VHAWLCLDLVPDAVPVERGLATDVQAREAALEKSQRRVQFERRVGAGEDATGETDQPTGADVVHGQISGDSERARSSEVTGLPGRTLRTGLVVCSSLS